MSLMANPERPSSKLPEDDNPSRVPVQRGPEQVEAGAGLGPAAMGGAIRSAPEVLISDPRLAGARHRLARRLQELADNPPWEPERSDDEPPASGS